MAPFSRTSQLIGEEKLTKLRLSNIAIFGIGGVGSFVVEGLARCGVSNFVLIDNDVIDVTNINRQIMALHSTIGLAKVDVAKNRILNINPKANVITYNYFYDQNAPQEFLYDCDYVVDAIDTVSSKLTLIEECNKKNIPIISCMGTGNKLIPTLFEVSDIFSTSVCPLCRVMRRELKKRNIKTLKVVYSKEVPNQTDKTVSVPASISFVPSVAGLIIASEVVKDIFYFL